LVLQGLHGKKREYIVLKLLETLWRETGHEDGPHHGSKTLGIGWEVNGDGFLLRKKAGNGDHGIDQIIKLTRDFLFLYQSLRNKRLEGISIKELEFRGRLDFRFPNQTIMFCASLKA
jgi:hypothetical protein